MRRLRAGGWILLPQAVSRLTSVYVFAVVAHHASAAELGALAIGTAVASAAVALAPAVVGKPLAALGDEATRREQAPLAQSAAVLGLAGVGVLLGLAAVATGGLTRLALAGGAIGLPAAMIVESTYWRTVFVQGARPAGLGLSAAYVAQAVLVTVAALWVPSGPLVVAPFAALCAVAVVVVLRQRGLSLHGARQWAGPFRSSWVPYVLGVLASLLVVQTIPPVLTATAGFAAASVYRAGELAFGGTNLLIGVASQTLLTQGSTRPRRAYAQVSALICLIAALNGLVLALVPESLVRLVLGPVTHLLLGVLGLMTVQRIGLAVSSIGATLIVPLVSARRFGLLDVLTAVVAMTALVVGGVLGGLTGALIGLAAAEIVFALGYGFLLRRST